MEQEKASVQEDREPKQCTPQLYENMAFGTGSIKTFFSFSNAFAPLKNPLTVFIKTT